MRAERPNDAGHLRQSRDALRAFTPAGSSRAPHLGGFRARPAYPFAFRPPPFTSVAGASRTRATTFFGLGPAPPDSLAAVPRNGIEIRPIRLCFPTLRQRAPVPCLLPAHRHRVFPGRALSGMPPTETGEPCASRRTDRFGGSRGPSWGHVLPSARAVCFPGPRDRVTEPLTPLSQAPLGAGAAHFRGARTSDPVKPAETASTPPA